MGIYKNGRNTETLYHLGKVVSTVYRMGKVAYEAIVGYIFSKDGFSVQTKDGYIIKCKDQ